MVNLMVSCLCHCLGECSWGLEAAAQPAFRGFQDQGEEGIPNTVKSGGLEKSQGQHIFGSVAMSLFRKALEDWNKGLVWFQTALVLRNVL